MKCIRCLTLLCLSLACLSGAQANFEIQRWTTEQDIEVYYVYRSELPMVDLSLIFDAGSIRDGKQYGLAHLTAKMLVHGAGGLSADHILAHFDSIGARYGAAPGRDLTTLSLRTLTEHLQKAIDMFITVVSSPDFPDEALAQVKARTLTTIHKQKQEPRAIAGITLFKTLYGDHPYGHPGIGEEQTVKMLSRDQLKDFYQRYFVRNNLTLTVVGDITKDQVNTLAKNLSGKLEAGTRAPPLPLAKVQTEARKVHVPFDSNQAHVYIAQLAVTHKDPDYFPLYVANHIFGGSGFGSRLLEEVRVKHGYAYSAWSYLALERMRGPFVIGFQTHVDQTDTAIALVYKLLEKYISEGPTEKELELSKNHTQGNFPLRVSSNGQISGWVRRIALEQHELNFLDTFTNKVNQVTRADIINVLQQRIDPNKMTTIIVGGQ